jgi:hypothetical protein
MTILCAASGPGTWLQSQPQVLFFLLVAVVWLINAVKRALAGSKAQGQGGQPPARAGQDPDDDERARRVREEILRKVTERQLGRAPAQAERAPRQTVAPRPRRPMPPPYVSRPQEIESAGIPMVPVRSADAPPGVAAAPAAGASQGAMWLDALRSREGIRRAVLVREILGPPLALRR